jgi:hypothetical protein
MSSHAFSRLMNTKCMFDQQFTVETQAVRLQLRAMAYVATGAENRLYVTFEIYRFLRLSQRGRGKKHEK